MLTLLKLARQFVACIHFLHRHHNREILGPGDKVQEIKPEQDLKESQYKSHTYTLS